MDNTNASRVRCGALGTVYRAGRSCFFVFNARNALTLRGGRYPGNLTRFVTGLGDSCDLGN